MTPTRAAEMAFRWLMLAYPPEFRRAHGLALFELFRDDLRAVAIATLAIGIGAPPLRRNQRSYGGRAEAQRAKAA